MKQYPIFKNLKVIDLSTVLAGPSVGSFFAELGAHVIKIEHPKHPDITRSWKLPTEDETASISAYFSSVNYKKTYRNIDFTIPYQKQQFFNLISQSHIVLMNFKKGDQEKLGLSDQQLRSINSRLIIGKINGFGVDSDRVAYDLILQAESGIMSMNGTPNSGPVKMPIAFIDVLAAHHLKEGLLIELWNSKNNPDYIGKSVAVSLYDAAVSSLVNQASNYLMEDFIPQRMGSLHPNIAPYGELFITKDQKTITFAIGSNKHFSFLCNFLKLDELISDNKFNTVQNRVINRERLFSILYPKVKRKSSKEIFQYMHKHAVPCGEIKNLKGVFNSSLAQGLIREEKIEGKVTRRVSGVAFSVVEDY